MGNNKNKKLYPNNGQKKQGRALDGRETREPNRETKIPSYLVMLLRISRCMSVFQC
jgi:hypothetical protein